MDFIENYIQVCDFERSGDFYDSIFKNLKYLNEYEYIDIISSKDLVINVLIDLYLEYGVEIKYVCLHSDYDGEYVISISKDHELYIEKVWTDKTRLVYSEPKIRYICESCNYKILTENPNQPTTVIFGLKEIS